MNWTKARLNELIKGKRGVTAAALDQDSMLGFCVPAILTMTTLAQPAKLPRQVPIYR